MITKKTCPISLSLDVIKEYTKLSTNGQRSRSQLIDDDLIKVVELRKTKLWPPGAAAASVPTDLEKIIEEVVYRILQDSKVHHHDIPIQEVKELAKENMQTIRPPNTELAKKAASSIASILRSREAKP